MAGMSFLDFMFAEALASGLAREAARQQQPPPDNFFLLPPVTDAWNKIQEASRKENMVVCVEFTGSNCKPLQHIFMDLAREFDGIPFLRAEIRPGITYDKMRSDLGGVEVTPTILVVFYGDDSVSRAKFEGGAEVRDVAKLRLVIKELIDRRVKLKMAERLATGLAEQLQSRLSDRDRKIREEYETRLQRQMAEKEEEIKKKDEERKKQEEKDEQEKDQRLRAAKERLRNERPQRLEELSKMDLDTAPIKDLKSIMEKMAIPSRGCLNRKDLKERLLESVPELRLKQPSSPARPRDEPIVSMPINEMEGLKLEKNDLKRERDSLKEEKDALRKERDSLHRETDTLKRKLSDLRNTETYLRDQLSVLESENSRLRNRNKTTSAPSASGNESSKVKKLEKELLQTRMLYTTSLEDFEIMDVIAECDKDNESLILRAKCIKPGLPDQDGVYAVKFLSDYLHGTTQTKVRRDFQNEYQLLCNLPPHDNIIHMWAFFFDRPGPDVIKYFKRTDGNVRTLGLFILMDEHPHNMADHLATLTRSRGPLSAKVCSWFRDLLSGLVFLEKHCAVHRDLKLSNLLMTGDGKVVICDFGKAILMDETFSMEYKFGGIDVGGNQAHLAPEILNCKMGPRSRLNYSRQPVWAAGVLAYELAGHQSPFQSGTIDQRGYGVQQLPALKTTYCNNPLHCQQLPPALTALVQSMLQPNPKDRPTLQHCLDIMNNL